jgi:ribokinase
MILVAGSANLDFVVQANHIPQPGETVLGRNFQTFPGGKGANQAVACARAGGAVTHMLVALGNDAFAKPLQTSLREAGVVLHEVPSNQAPTGCAFICVSDGGENAITVAPGANATLRPEHWHSHATGLEGFTHLLMQLEIPLETVQAYAQAGQNAGLVVVLNAAPAQQLPPALLALTDVLVVNEGELAEVAAHQGSIAECLPRIAVPTVVVTLGHRGCCMRHQGTLIYQPGFAITPVDTTGAGDTFCGALVAAMAQGSDAAGALARACAAAALACLQLGAQSSIPSAAAVDAFLADQAPATPADHAALQRYCTTTTS